MSSKGTGKLYCCTICPMELFTSIHQHQHHINVNHTMRTHTKSLNKNPKLLSFSCDKCNMTFENMEEVKEHKKTQNYLNSKAFKCTKCEVKNCDYKGIKAHYANTHIANKPAAAVPVATGTGGTSNVENEIAFKKAITDDETKGSKDSCAQQDESFKDAQDNNAKSKLIPKKIAKPKFEALLNLAVTTGNEEELKNWIEQRINTKDKNSLTALHKASEAGYVSPVKYLIQIGALIEAKDNDKETPLHKAAKKGRLDIVKCLIQNGAKIDPKNEPLQDTPLIHAVNEKHFEIIKFLIQNGAQIDAKDYRGRSPLTFAAYMGYLEVVQYLVDHKANIDTTDKMGLTSLQSAMNRDHVHVEVAKFLIESGAKINVKDNIGLTPLHYAANLHSLSLVNLLVEKGAQIDAKDPHGLTSLQYATKNGRLEVVKLLIEKGAQIDVKDKNGLTLLHDAVKRNSLELVKLLVEKGAETDVTNNSNETPLMSAVIQKSLEVAKYLMGSWATMPNTYVEYKDPGLTLLHWALFYNKADKGGSLELYNLLLDRPEIDAKDTNGLTPLENAIKNGWSEMAKLLIKQGAQMDTKDIHGLTPLQNIAKNLDSCNGYEYGALGLGSIFSRIDLVELLVEKGAQINAKDRDGLTPLHDAVKRGSEPGSLELVKILVEKGATIDIINNNNETPFYLAKKHKHEEIAKFLLEKKREIESKKPQENFSNKDPCIICLEPRNSLYVLNPCGHMSLCEDCSYNLVQETYPKCPTCRKPVQNYIKVFYQT